MDQQLAMELQMIRRALERIASALEQQQRRRVGTQVSRGLGDPKGSDRAG